jgi:hypothetical protein
LVASCAVIGDARNASISSAVMTRSIHQSNHD